MVPLSSLYVTRGAVASGWFAVTVISVQLRTASPAGVNRSARDAVAGAESWASSPASYLPVCDRAWWWCVVTRKARHAAHSRVCEAEQNRRR